MVQSLSLPHSLTLCQICLNSRFYTIYPRRASPVTLFLSHYFTLHIYFALLFLSVRILYLPEIYMNRISQTTDIH